MQGNDPVAGATVTVRGTNKSTVTNSKGEFELELKSDEKIIEISNVGFAATAYDVSSLTDLSINLGGGASTSLKNYWVGAKLGYNFLSESTDDFFVGSASIAINLLKLDEKSKHTFGVVGNIGNFKFQNDSAENKKIQKLTQSINGLLFGLGYTYETNSSDKKQAFRKFANVGARLSSYTNVGKDSQTVNLPQFASTIGFEYELQGFTNAGALTLSAGASLFLFSKTKYEKIFNKDRGNILTLDVSAILPLSKNLGFFVNGTYSKIASPVYIIGIVIHPEAKK